jgi:predicted aminopeptidase
MRSRKRCVPVLLVAAALALGGCATAGYYLQAVRGQMELSRLARPVPDVQGDPAVPPAVKAKLAAAMRIRDFASRELALPDNGSFRSYADLGRPSAVWTVFAAEEFSVRLTEWCFPVAGCVNYRGYFAQGDAEAFAAELRRDGFEVDVGGVPAYSTLGWFDDPLLNTFLHYPEPELVRLIVHELAHQVLYVKDDTEFNESFAVVVEQEGLRRWLAQAGDSAQRDRALRMQRIRADFQDLVLRARQGLEALYASALAPEEKRRAKARIFDGMRREYDALKAERWQGFDGYDRWFGQDLNNARLASVGLYHGLVPAFEALLEQNGRDLPRFYEAVKRLAALPKDERRRRLTTERSAGRSEDAGGSV